MEELLQGRGKLRIGMNFGYCYFQAESEALEAPEPEAVSASDSIYYYSTIQYSPVQLLSQPPHPYF